MPKAQDLGDGDESDSELDAERYADLISTDEENAPASPTLTGS